MQNSPVSHKTYFQFAAIGIAVAVVAVVVVWLVASLISPDMYVKDTSGDYAKLTVFGAATAAIFYSVVATVVGWVLFFFRRPASWWYVIGGLVILGTGWNAFANSQTNETGIWLNIMHFVAAAAMLPTIGRILDLRAAK